MPPMASPDVLSQETTDKLGGVGLDPIPLTFQEWTG